MGTEARDPGAPPSTAADPSVVVSTEVFYDLFAGPGGIRVWMNWDRVRSLGVPVRVTFVASFGDLGEGFLPWYLGHGGEEVDFDDQARAVSLGEFPEIEPSLRPERCRKIEDLRTSLSSSESMHLLVPAYDLGGGRRLYVDGCHRLAALAGATTGLKAVVFTLEGPLDPDILPDLSHWGEGPS